MLFSFAAFPPHESIQKDAKKIYITSVYYCTANYLLQYFVVAKNHISLKKKKALLDKISFPTKWIATHIVHSC